MIKLIAAIDLNSSLGFENKLLTKLPNDMKHFKKLTTNGFVCMGRRTYDSIGHALPNRTNIILTRNKKYKAPVGTFVYHSIEEVIEQYKNQNNNESELYFIGGSEVYNQALPYCDRIYLTIIQHTFPEVDTWFPRISLVDWKPIETVKNKADDKNEHDHFFVTYERRNNQK